MAGAASLAVHEGVEANEDVREDAVLPESELGSSHHGRGKQDHPLLQAQTLPPGAKQRPQLQG